MSGDIHVASGPGAGSKFTAALRPKRAAEPAARAAKASAQAGQHVLLALDRPIERRALRLSLEGAGIPVEEGTSTAADELIGGRQCPRAFSAVLVGGEAGREAAKQLSTAHERSPRPDRCRASSCWTRPPASFADFRAAADAIWFARSTAVRPHAVSVRPGACAGSGSFGARACAPRRQDAAPRAVGRGQRHQCTVGAAHAGESRLRCAGARQRPRGRRRHSAAAGRTRSALRCGLHGRTYAGPRRPRGNTHHQGAVCRTT